MAAVTESGTWGYINLDGEYLIEPGFLWVGDFDNGFALVKTENGDTNYDKVSGYLIDKLGNKYLEELEITEISKFNDSGYALAYSGNGKSEYYMIHIDGGE